MTGRELYGFGEFTLDVPERRLTRAGRPIRLAPKALELLVALVRRAGRLITKQELLDIVWPDTFVEEGILAVHVSALRKAIGDTNGESTCIETIPKAGYRFIAEVRGSSPHVSDRSRRHSARFFELLGRGRLHLLSAVGRETRDAVSVFQAAIELDPTYPAAHAGLALAWCAQADARVAPPADAYREARTAALRALALDSACADAQLALGTVLFLGEWDWTGAERSLIRALDINPDYSEAYVLYGRLLEATGRLEDGLAMTLRALERDPDSPAVHVQIAHAYWNLRMYDETIAWSERTLALDPNHLLAREYLAGAYLKKGDSDRHMAENMRHAEAAGASDELLEPFRRAYARGGRRAVIAQTLDLLNGTEAPAMQLAILHGEHGNLDAAFEYLNRAIDARDSCLVHLAVSPQWDPLRGDPRFDRCLSRMGLAGLAPRSPCAG